ncbi:hypothetical protein EYC84_011923 [Monilinia fructicola]|uniref:Uncharacterized protein n=1 Tax=Monilinia fructicola TaxID=38448 RepID=A0A5M9J9H6_MONFR|nr:hypothetical protein EYC84_011923 [Monilinia fructicola]
MNEEQEKGAAQKHMKKLAPLKSKKKKALSKPIRSFERDPLVAQPLPELFGITLRGETKHGGLMSCSNLLFHHIREIRDVNTNQP